jgi:hypothetical protein
MREKLAVSQGEGRNVTEGNLGGLQYTGRLEFLPFGKFQSKGDYVQAAIKREATPKLMIGFTYNYNQDAVRERGFAGDYMFTTSDETKNGDLYATDQTTIFADAMFKYEGFSFMGEYANRSAKDAIAVGLDGITPTGDVVLTGEAINLQAGYMFKSNYEIAGRFTNATYKTETGRLPEQQYTLGGSKYLVGHKLKVQTDLSYTTVDNQEDNITFRIGFDIHF